MKKYNNLAILGSLMIEALAMLGLISMVTPIVYKKAAERTSELQDINEASYLRAASKALDDYLLDNYTSLEATADDGKPEEISDEGEVSAVLSYLPVGMNTSSKLFNDLSFYKSVRMEMDGGEPTGKKVVTGFVVAKPKDAATAMRSSRIASMIGANGGHYMSGEKVQGVQGIWEAEASTFGLTADDQNAVVVSSAEAISGGIPSSKDVLHRVAKGTDVDRQLNTMETNLYMGVGEGRYNIEDIGQIIVGARNPIGGGGITDALHVADGTTSLGGTLAVTGAATLEDALTVGGGATLNDALTVAKDVTFTGKMEVKDGETKITTAKTDINDQLIVGEDGTPGDTKVYIKDGILKAKMLEADNLMSDENGLKVLEMHAGASSKEGPFLLHVDEGSLTTQGDYRIDLDPDSHLYLGKDGAEELDLSGGKATLTGANGETLALGSNKAELIGKSGGPSLTLDDNVKLGDSEDYLQISSSDVTLKQGSATGKNQLTLNGTSGASLTGTGEYALTIKDNLVLGKDGGSGLTIGADGNILIKGATTFTPDSTEIMKVADTGVSVGKSFVVNADASGDASTNSLLTVSNEEGAIRGKVHIRSGVLEIQGQETIDPTDLQGATGYIRADKMVSTIPYENPYSGLQAEGGGDVDRKEGFYQVNPAYTSVMHDIKLSTRGGARLSDVLPDFINKGIYVVDTTYRECQEGDAAPLGKCSGGSFNWETEDLEWSDIEAELGKGSYTLQACDSDSVMSECHASPWMGFVPAPQCPYGYSKVATITPVRFVASKAYSQVVNNGGGEVLLAEKYYPTEFNWLDSNGAIVAPNTGTAAEAEKGDQSPLTFQTHNWLSSSLKKFYGTSGAQTNSSDAPFRGWSAIMGYIYPVAQYSDFISEKYGSIDDEGGIIWNLFPVYNSELSAIVTVYCYFNREAFTAGNEEITEETETLVDVLYDQLDAEKIRVGRETGEGDDAKGSDYKPKGYGDRLNDAATNWSSEGSYDEYW